MSRRGRRYRRRKPLDDDVKIDRTEIDDATRRATAWAAEAGLVGKSEMPAVCDRCGRLSMPYVWVEDVRGHVRWHLMSDPDEPMAMYRCGRISWSPPPPPNT